MSVIIIKILLKTSKESSPEKYYWGLRYQINFEIKKERTKNFYWFIFA